MIVDKVQMPPGYVGTAFSRLTLQQKLAVGAEPEAILRGRTRFWAVRDVGGNLICVCVYKRGALEAARRLSLETGDGYLCEIPPQSARGFETSAQIPLDNPHESPERGSRSGAKPTQQRKTNRMKNNTESKKTATPKASKAKREAAVKAPTDAAEAQKPAKKSKQESERSTGCRPTSMN